MDGFPEEMVSSEWSVVSGAAYGTVFSFLPYRASFHLLPVPFSLIPDCPMSQLYSNSVPYISQLYPNPI